MRSAPVLQPARGMYLCIPHPYPMIIFHPRPSSTPFTSFVPRTHIRRNALLTLLRAIATEQTAVVSPVSPNLLPRPALVELSARLDFTSELARTYATSLRFASVGTYDKTLPLDSAEAIYQHSCVRRVVRRSEITVLGPLDLSSEECATGVCAGRGNSAIARESMGIPSHICVLWLH